MHVSAWQASIAVADVSAERIHWCNRRVALCALVVIPVEPDRDRRDLLRRSHVTAANLAVAFQGWIVAPCVGPLGWST